jgi:hypothetical protein
MDRCERIIDEWLEYWQRNAKFFPPDALIFGPHSPVIVDLAHRLDMSIASTARCFAIALAGAGYEFVGDDS